MYICNYVKKHNIYGLCSICGFRHVLGVLEYVLTDEGQLLYSKFIFSSRNILIKNMILLLIHFALLLFSLDYLCVQSMLIHFYYLSFNELGYNGPRVAFQASYYSQLEGFLLSHAKIKLPPASMAYPHNPHASLLLYCALSWGEGWLAIRCHTCSCTCCCRQRRECCILGCSSHLGIDSEGALLLSFLSYSALISNMVPAYTDFFGVYFLVSPKWSCLGQLSLWVFLSWSWSTHPSLLI